jgi:predicted acylesterase/phospholipase RssA/CRP-like cAMP-binding protein
MERRFRELTLPARRMTTTPGIFGESLASFPIFRSLSDETLRRLDAHITRVRARGGETLFEQGDAADCMYVVVYGRLRITIRGADGDERILRELGRGEPVGELAILTGDPRSATVRVIRDTELLRLSQEGFQQLIATSPQAMLELARLIVHRLQHPERSPGHGRMTALALLPASDNVPVEALAEKLTTALAAAGHNVRRLDADAVDEYLDETRAATDPEYIERELPRWLHEQESQHDLLVYVGEGEPSQWTALCLRQADTVLVVGRGGEPCHITAGLAEMLAQRKGPASCRTELVLLYDSARSRPSHTLTWLNPLGVESHHHVDLNKSADVARLARMLTGEAIGLVLGGGGARGFAHVGILKALAEANVPVDLVGGTSMGSIIAAQSAAGWSWEQIRDNCRRAFIDAGSLDDYTIPVMALLRGRRYRRMLAKLFGDLRIEDLPLPFYCVSTNLTRCVPMIHTRGLVAQWVGASIAVPGLGPPVFFQREVLVDGGVVNNLPADIMAAFGRGPVFASSVTPDTELPLDDDYGEEISPWRVLLSRLNPLGKPLGVPGIGSILMQTAWISQATAGATVRRNVDLYFEPPVAQFRLRDWHALDELIELGYQHAREKIAAWRANIF